MKQIKNHFDTDRNFACSKQKAPNRDKLQRKKGKRKHFYWQKRKRNLSKIGSFRVKSGPRFFQDVGTCFSNSLSDLIHLRYLVKARKKWSCLITFPMLAWVLFFLVACDATLHPALLVRRSVGWLVRHTLLFFFGPSDLKYSPLPSCTRLG